MRAIKRRTIGMATVPLPMYLEYHSSEIAGVVLANTHTHTTDVCLLQFYYHFSYSSERYLFYITSFTAIQSENFPQVRRPSPTIVGFVRAETVNIWRRFCAGRRVAWVMSYAHIEGSKYFIVFIRCGFGMRFGVWRSTEIQFVQLKRRSWALWTRNT